MKKIIAVFLVLMMTSCSKPDKKEVSLVLDWIPNTNHTGFYVAMEKGFYKDEGISLNIQQPSEDGGLPLLASGKADFAISAQESIATAITAKNPLPVVSVAALLQHNTSGIISLKEKNITSPKKMEGRTYATWDLPVEKEILRQCITADGGNFDKIKMIPSTVTDVITALKTNIDCVWVFYGWDGIATEVKNLDTNFFYFKDFAQDLDFYTPILASSEKYLKENGEVTKKFLRATAKGYEYAIKNPKEAADILCKYAPETNKEIAEKSQVYLADKYIADSPKWGYIDQKRWDRFFEWLNKTNIIHVTAETKRGFTNEFLDS